MITIYFEVIDYEYIWFAKRSLGKREKKSYVYKRSLRKRQKHVNEANFYWLIGMHVTCSRDFIWGDELESVFL